MQTVRKFAYLEHFLYPCIMLQHTKPFTACLRVTASSVQPIFGKGGGTNILGNGFISIKNTEV